TNTRPYYRKKFEQIWTTDEHHINIMKEAWHQQEGSIETKLQHTMESLHSWGRKFFGIIPKRIKEVQQELHLMQQDQDNQSLNQQIKHKEQEFDDLIEKEDLWWSQSLGPYGLLMGIKTLNFSTKKLVNTTTNIAETVQVVQNKLTQDMYDVLHMAFTEEEVFNAIKDMKALASPGPAGLPARFYHTYWDIVGKDMTNIVLHVLNHDDNPQPFNKTHICLIPKTNNPSLPSDYRPISLCNVTLKIITKTIANRIKIILPNIISPNQSAFVSGRLITDNTIIANEIFHYLNQTTRQTGYVGIKTDMAKAYDRLEWGFLQATLEAMNFPPTMVKNVMKCVTTVSFSILINGKPTKAFSPEKGS
ncbi:non-LTR retroelement reverse transcriptase, partial [Trifolium medium]|nr:non-LTR retroelement reverse transcriptase [Trifolium medium]